MKKEHLHPLADAHEIAFIQSFIEKRRVVRLMEARGAKKHRHTFLEELTYFASAKPEMTITVSGGLGYCNVAELLRNLGAPDAVYVASTINHKSGAEVDIYEALEDADYDGGTLISCLAGKLCYCVGEYGLPKLILTTKPERVRMLMGE
jgi:hypothetical protein